MFLYLLLIHPVYYSIAKVYSSSRNKGRSCGFSGNNRFIVPELKQVFLQNVRLYVALKRKLLDILPPNIVYQLGQLGAREVFLKNMIRRDTDNMVETGYL